MVTLYLSSQTKPKYLHAKSHPSDWARGLGLPVTFGSGGIVRIGDYMLPMQDFLMLAFYAVTNTNLEGENDPRVRFVECMQTMEAVQDIARIEQGVENPNPRRFRSLFPYNVGSSADTDQR